ncbi:MAG TPA: ThuA domain-containing protein [Tepidisphaeraceae bacterium]|jgi:type 1 glutamine amidotransferase
MSNGLNRRELLKGAGIATAGLLASPLLNWASAQGQTKKMLFFSRSQTYEHSAITRPKKDQEAMSFAEKFMIDFGKKVNLEVTCSKDGGLFTAEGLAKFDVIMFYTTGQLEKPGDPKNGASNNKPMPEGGKQALLDAIAGGKGFLGVHSATDTWDKNPGPVDPYIKMIGGEFVIHHQQEKCEIQAIEHNWGTIKDLQTFTKNEEWYRLHNIAPDLHVIAVQNTKSMKQKEYNALDPYPETWARKHGKGRVFYTSMGHREDVWASDEFQNVLQGGLNFVAGKGDAELKPNVMEVTPKALMRPADTAV